MVQFRIRIAHLMEKSWYKSIEDRITYPDLMAMTPTDGTLSDDANMKDHIACYLLSIVDRNNCVTIG